MQEALINILRHANSPTARISVRISENRLTLEIQDRGSGMSAELTARVLDGNGAFGVGVVGMRERLERLGGSFAMESGLGGTTVRASVPIPAKAS